MWTYHANNQSPAAVATVYAAREFDPPRELDSAWGWMSGGGRWIGGFRVKGDVRVYNLRGDGGVWTVEPDDAPLDDVVVPDQCCS